MIRISRHFRSFRIRSKIFRMLTDIYKLDRHSGAFTTSEKCLGTPGTPGVFEKSCKNIIKLDIHSGAFTTSEKCLGPSGTPGVF